MSSSERPRPVTLVILVLACCALRSVTANTTSPTRLHTFLLLDRSGSMNAIKDDMVGSLNNYITELQSVPHSDLALVTLAQFDSVNPFEVLQDARNLTQVELLKSDQFTPRSMTPLYDAVASMISHADHRSNVRQQLGAPPERVVLVIITDGKENASRLNDRKMVAELVSQRQ